MLEKSTYYILDAQGNQLSMYEHFVKDNTAKFYLTERNIYGSSRLGVTNDTINMFIPEILPSYGILGNRTYELSNHLGNVLTTISDIKYPLSDDNVSISGYEVGINGISDYSPFGAPLDGRTVGRLGKYEFNSQERDDEVSGEGNSYTAEFCQYNPRLGRRWEMDPVVKSSISSYSTFSNNPILLIDPNGDTDYEFNKRSGKIKAVESSRDDGPDRIINGKAKYKDGELKNVKLNVLQLDGKIENFKNSSGKDQDGPFEFQTYTLSNSEDGDKAFEFMANKTDIEISKSVYKLKNGEQQTRFYTTGSTIEIRGEYMFIEWKIIPNNSGIKLLYQMHNHGNPEYGKMGSYGPSSPDKNFADKVSTLFKDTDTQPKFFVWRFYTKTEYDENGIVKEK